MKMLYKIVWFKKANIENMKRVGVDPDNYGDYILCGGPLVYTSSDEAVKEVAEWNTKQSVWTYSLLAVPYEGEL